MVYQQENFANKNPAMNLSFNVSGGKLAPLEIGRKTRNSAGLNPRFSAVKFGIRAKRSLCPEETAQAIGKNSLEHSLFPC